MVKYTPEIIPTFSPDIEDEELRNISGDVEDTPDILSDEPIAVYIPRGITKKGAKVLKVLPALRALKDNERYSIVKGDEEGVFAMHEKRGVASLSFTKQVEKKVTYHLEIKCEIIHRNSDVDLSQTLDQHIRLDVYIL